MGFRGSRRSTTKKETEVSFNEVIKKIKKKMMMDHLSFTLILCVMGAKDGNKQGSDLPFLPVSRSFSKSPTRNFKKGNNGGRARSTSGDRGNGQRQNGRQSQGRNRDRQQNNRRSKSAGGKSFKPKAGNGSSDVVKPKQQDESQQQHHQQQFVQQTTAPVIYSVLPQQMVASGGQRVLSNAQEEAPKKTGKNGPYFPDRRSYAVGYVIAHEKRIADNPDANTYGHIRGFITKSLCSGKQSTMNAIESTAKRIRDLLLVKGVTKTASPEIWVDAFRHFIRGVQEAHISGFVNTARTHTLHDLAIGMTQTIGFETGYSNHTAPTLGMAVALYQSGINNFDGTQFTMNSYANAADQRTLTIMQREVRLDNIQSTTAIVLLGSINFWPKDHAIIVGQYAELYMLDKEHASIMLACVLNENVDYGVVDPKGITEHHLQGHKRGQVMELVNQLSSHGIYQSLREKKEKKEGSDEEEKNKSNIFVDPSKPVQFDNAKPVLVIPGVNFILKPDGEIVIFRLPMLEDVKTENIRTLCSEVFPVMFLVPAGVTTLMTKVQVHTMSGREDMTVISILYAAGTGSNGTPRDIFETKSGAYTETRLKRDATIISELVRGMRRFFMHSEIFALKPGSNTGTFPACISIKRSQVSERLCPGLSPQTLDSFITFNATNSSIFTPKPKTVVSLFETLYFTATVHYGDIVNEKNPLALLYDGGAPAFGLQEVKKGPRLSERRSKVTERAIVPKFTKTIEISLPDKVTIEGFPANQDDKLAASCVSTSALGLYNNNHKSQTMAYKKSDRGLAPVFDIFDTGFVKVDKPAKKKADPLLQGPRSFYVKCTFKNKNKKKPNRTHTTKMEVMIEPRNGVLCMFAKGPLPQNVFKGYPVNIKMPCETTPVRLLDRVGMKIDARGTTLVFPKSKDLVSVEVEGDEVKSYQIMFSPERLFYDGKSLDVKPMKIDWATSNGDMEQKILDESSSEFSNSTKIFALLVWNSINNGIKVRKDSIEALGFEGLILENITKFFPYTEASLVFGAFQRIQQACQHEGSENDYCFGLLKHKDVETLRWVGYCNLADQTRAFADMVPFILRDGAGDGVVEWSAHKRGVTYCVPNDKVNGNWDIIPVHDQSESFDPPSGKEFGECTKVSSTLCARWPKP